MKEIAECPNDVEQVERRLWSGSIREKRGSAVVVSGEVPFALYRIDDDRLMPAGKRCDGLLVTAKPPAGLVCFVEVKGKLDDEKPDRPFEQIQHAIEHFAPLPDGTAHGDEHHVAWRAGDDLPDAPLRNKRAPIPLGGEHAIHGVVVVSRGGTRLKPRWLAVAGREVFVAVVAKHGTHDRTELKLGEIEGALP